MKRLPFTFHHLGLAARKRDAATRFAQSMGYEIGPTIRDPRQNVDLSMCTHGAMPRLEIVTPTETAGPLATLLRSHTELVYHVCYEVPSIPDALSHLKADVGNVRCVQPPTPAVLFGERQVGFYLVPGVGLVELLEAA